MTDAEHDPVSGLESATWWTRGKAIIVDPVLERVGRFRSQSIPLWIYRDNHIIVCKFFSIWKCTNVGWIFKSALWTTLQQHIQLDVLCIALQKVA